MRTLYLIRHAPTHAKAMVGWTDLPGDCSDTAAFARLAALLPQGATLVSSDLARAVATADALALPAPRLPHHPGLREIHFGAWEMRTYAEVEAEDATIRAFWDRPGEVAPPGGESWNALAARVHAALDDLLARTAGDLVAVSHFGAILTAIQRATGQNALQTFAQKIDNLSLTEIAIDAAGWRLVRANHSA